MRTRGFTLLEIMIVVAILGILASLSITTMEGARARTAPRNAAADLSQAISLARARALERGSNVWLILYPNRGKDLSTAGNGAWFLYDDGDGNFGATGSLQCTGAAGSNCNYATFTPPNTIWPPRVNTTDFLLDRVYFDDAPKKAVKFGQTSDTTILWGEPFGAAGTGLNAGTVTKDCSFCTGTGVARRGAIIFNGDGAVRFVDGSGNPVYETTGGFSIQNSVAMTKQVTLFGVAAATGYVGVYQ
jgi:prepilin-type N-terminal cleavage/methylation domain-containing protein